MEVIEFDRVTEVIMYQGANGELFTTWIGFFINADLERCGAIIEEIEI